MFHYLSIIDTSANIILLCVSIAVVVILVKVERRVKQSRKTMFPYVLLFRSSGDAVPLGTFAVREYAVRALDAAVRNANGLVGEAEFPPTVLERFKDDHSSWRGKNVMGDSVHIWIAEVKK